MDRRSAAACLFALAIVVRVAGAYYASQHQERFDYPDSRRYALVARNVAEGRGLIETTHNRTGNDPILPILLAPAWWLSGATLYSVYDMARVLNIAFGLAAMVVLMYWARSLAGPTAEIVVGLLFALDPILLFFHLLPLTELPFVGCFWLGLYAMWRGIRDASWRWTVASGVALGAGVLVRSSALPLAAVLPLAMLLGRPAQVHTGANAATLEQPMMDSHRSGLGARIGRAACLGLVLVACIAPFTYRNYKLLGQFSPVRTGSGATLLESLGPWADGGPGMEKVDWPDVPPNANEHQRDTIFRDAALHWAREHPADVARLAVAKVLRTWSPAPNAPGYRGGVFAWIGWLTVTPVLIAAVIGSAMLWRTDRLSLTLLLAPALYFTLLHSVFVGSVRYRVPVMPGLFVLAAVAAARLAQSPRRA